MHTTNDPSRLDRAISAVAWWSPELIVTLVAGLTAWLLWPPSAVLAVAALARIAADPIVRQVRAARRRARLAAAARPVAEPGADEPDETGARETA